MRNPNIRGEGEAQAPQPEPGKLPEMKPRFIGIQAEYAPAIYDPETGNTSGLTPYGPNILVRMDVCLTVTKGGVHIVDDIAERMTEASVTGAVFAIGPDAFAGLHDKPLLGQRIYIDKYAGIKTRGQDGELYRVVDEKCVACGIADGFCVSEA